MSFMTVGVGASMRQTDDGTGDWSAHQWAAWRDAQIARILSPSFLANGKIILSREEVISRSVDAYRFLRPHLSDPAFLRSPTRGKELSNFARFVTGQSTMAIYDGTGRYTHALGYGQTDKEYWLNSSSELRFPTLLSSQRFLGALESPRTYSKAIEILESQNLGLAADRKWTWLIYRSRFLKSTDTLTYGRLLVVVPNTPDGPNQVLDRWVQFDLAVPETVSGPELNSMPRLRSVSMVAVRRTSGGNAPGSGYLADFMRDVDPRTGELSIVPTMLESKNPSKNCYDCHKSPVLPIQPKSVFGFDSVGRLTPKEVGAISEVEAVNARIANYGKVELTSMDTDAYGPSIGPISRDRPDAFIRSASGDPSLSSESVVRIRNSMSCASCHDRFAKLNYPQAVSSNIGFLVFEQKVGLVQTFVENGWMPPRSDLSPSERKALWKCLELEYLTPRAQTGVFVDWLRGVNGQGEGK